MNKVTLLVFFIPFTACHANPAAASPPKLATPSVEIDVEDLSADHQKHLSHFSLGLVDGHASLSTGDNEARYRLEAHSVADGKLNVNVKRNGPLGDIEVSGAIPPKTEGPVLVARIERDGGHATQVVASLR